MSTYCPADTVLQRGAARHGGYYEDPYPLNPNPFYFFPAANPFFHHHLTNLTLPPARSQPFPCARTIFPRNPSVRLGAEQSIA